MSSLLQACLPVLEQPHPHTCLMIGIRVSSLGGFPALHNLDCATLVLFCLKFYPPSSLSPLIIYSYRVNSEPGPAFLSLCPSYRLNRGPGPAFVLSIGSLQ